MERALHADMVRRAARVMQRIMAKARSERPEQSTANQPNTPRFVRARASLVAINAAVNRGLLRAGTSVNRWLIVFGRAHLFLWRMVVAAWGAPRWAYQLFVLGVLSLPVVAVASLFVGMVLALQGYYTLVRFGAEDSLGVLVALSLIRELAPVICGILYAGRSGSALTTEIGLMKTTEQLAAIELMGIDVARFIMRPRMIAGVIALPLLVVLFMAIGIMGAWMVSVGFLGVDGGAFWSQMQQQVDMRDDVLNGLYKAVVFAVVVNWLALFLGEECLPTSEGVSRATTATVVYSALWILALDFVLTSVMF